MKRSLHVGINEFTGLPGSNLQGCVNDAHDMADALSHVYGFNQVKILLNADASRRGILDGLDWLICGAQPGDELVCTFSCHGTQIDDKNGDEPDRLDEALCPADLNYKNWDSTLIVDDELAQYFSVLPEGVNLSVIADACHSGSVMRDVFRRPRFLPPRLRCAPALGPRPRRIGSCVIAETQRHVLLSGCRDTETSADAYIDGRYNGACTWALLQAIAENPNRTWRDAHVDMLKALKAGGHDQHPVLSGRADAFERPLFGGARAI
jgi:hypothetical protein